MLINYLHHDLEYFGNLKSSLKEDYYSHLLSYFLRNDISKWGIRRIPMARAKKEFLIIQNLRYFFMFKKENQNSKEDIRFRLLMTVIENGILKRL